MPRVKVVKKTASHMIKLFTYNTSW